MKALPAAQTPARLGNVVDVRLGNVQHVHADLVKILHDLQEFSTTVIPGVQSQFVSQGELPGEARFEQATPQGRRNHQPCLRAPIVGEVNAIETMTGRLVHQFTFKIENVIHEIGKAVRIEQQIFHGVLEAAQKGVNGEAAEIETGQAITIAANFKKSRHRGHAFLLADSGRRTPRAAGRHKPARRDGPWCRRQVSPGDNPIH